MIRSELKDIYSDIKKYKYTIDSKVIRRKYLDINDSDTVKKTYN